MLTRNLYEIDEVKSALQICIRNQSWRALFWLWELIVSEEIDDAKYVLRTTWLKWGAPYDIGIIQDINSAQYTENDSESCISLIRRIMEACGKTRELSAFHLLNEQIHSKPRTFLISPAENDDVTERRRIHSAKFVESLDSEDISAADASLFWIGLDSSLRKGNHTDVFWLLQAAQPIMSANAIWSAIRIASRGGSSNILKGLETTAPKDPTSQILHQAAALLFLCIRTADRDTTLAPTFPVNKILQRDWEKWSQQKNRRIARIHAIPKEALHTGTTRGQISAKYTNIADIREPIPLLLESCSWWRRIATESGIVEEDGIISFPSDDALENMHDRYFPDDLPDEWSAADQQKSHGRGVAETALPEPSIWIRTETPDTCQWKMESHNK